MSSTHVKVLKPVRIADGTHYGQEYAAGDTAEVATDLVAGLVAEGYVAVDKKGAKAVNSDDAGDNKTADDDKKTGGKGK